MARELRWVAVGALLFTWAFYYEYLPPVSRVHVPYDLQGYHYPLAEYGFQAFRQGRLPEWDASIYCGLTYAGNVQTALFYPPNWVLWVWNRGLSRLSFRSLEVLVFLHQGLAFVLCYLWLRAKGLAWLACALGAGGFAYGGYMASQNNHAGVVTGFAWTPLALWGIDQAAEGGSVRPLWKVAAASALCLLAGFPPTWLVLGVNCVVYAAAGRGRWRAAGRTVAALAASLAVAAVAILPAWEAASLKTFDPKFGHRYRSAGFYLTYLIPNYYDFSRSPVGPGTPPEQYLYLGSAALLGIGYAVLRRAQGAGPALAAGLASLVVLTDPGFLISTAVNWFPLLAQVCHSFNFLEGLQVALTLLAALGLHAFLRGEATLPPPWMTPAVVGLLVIWAARLGWLWRPGGPGLAAGWRSAVDVAAMAALAALALATFRGERGRRQMCLAAALLAAAGVEYKVFGTSRSFSAEPGNVDAWFNGREFVGMDDRVYRGLLDHPESRIVFGETGPQPTDVRHYRVATPQGFDPFLPAPYKAFLEAEGVTFRTDRLFDVDPANERLLRLLGVRYYSVLDNSQYYLKLLASPVFRLLEPSDSFLKTFEYLRAGPACYWEHDPAGSVERLRWEPERREVAAGSAAGGKLVLAEQHFPGWRAWVDGREVPIERWRGTFQAVRVPPGHHRVRFEFRSRTLRMGAWISAAAVAGLVAFLVLTRPERERRRRWQ